MRRNSPIRWLLVLATSGLFLLSPQSITAAAPPKKSAKPAASSAPTSATHKKKYSKAKPRKSSRKRGQKAIDSERTQQIQEALIREHYLDGKPSGKWDDATQAALRRYQADHGWQNKTVPDSRALIKLGLGPNHDHLLNPETAMTTVPAPAPKPTAKPATDPPAPAPSSDALPHP